MNNTRHWIFLKKIHCSLNIFIFNLRRLLDSNTPDLQIALRAHLNSNSFTGCCWEDNRRNIVKTYLYSTAISVASDQVHFIDTTVQNFTAKTRHDIWTELNHQHLIFVPNISSTQTAFSKKYCIMDYTPVCVLLLTLQSRPLQSKG